MFLGSSVPDLHKPTNWQGKYQLSSTKNSSTTGSTSVQGDGRTLISMPPSSWTLGCLDRHPSQSPWVEHMLRWERGSSEGELRRWAYGMGCFWPRQGALEGKGAGRVMASGAPRSQLPVRSREAILCEIQGAVLCAASPSSLPRTPALRSWAAGELLPED